MTTTNITNKQIKTLKSEAGQHGDLRMAMICDLATGGPESLEGAEPGTDADLLISEGRTQEWAREECARVIAEAEANADA